MNEHRIAAIIDGKDPATHQCYRLWYGDGATCIVMQDDTWTEHDICPSCHADVRAWLIDAALAQALSRNDERKGPA